MSRQDYEDFQIGAFTFSGHKDRDGEIEVCAEGWAENVTTWIDAKGARALIKHLNLVFKII
jgi:hypothetical protein